MEPFVLYIKPFVRYMEPFVLYIKLFVLCNRARLQSCRKSQSMKLGFSPWD